MLSQFIILGGEFLNLKVTQAGQWQSEEQGDNHRHDVVYGNNCRVQFINVINQLVIFHLLSSCSRVEGPGEHYREDKQCQAMSCDQLYQAILYSL